MNMRAIMIFLSFNVFAALLIITGFVYNAHSGAFSSIAAWWDNMNHSPQSVATIDVPSTPTVSASVVPKTIPAPIKPVIEHKAPLAAPSNVTNTTVANVANIQSNATPPSIDSIMPVSAKDTPVVLSAKNDIVPSVPSNPVINASNPIVSSVNTSNSSHTMCMTYGPLNLEQKSTLDVILKKEDIQSPVSVSQKPLYQIYWSLGHDQSVAMDLFEKQKNGGPLRDEKFKLKQDEAGDWGVNIIVISGTPDIAKNVTNSLSASAPKAGGKWLFKSVGDGYYYQFNDISHVSPSSLNIIDRIIHPNKVPC